jgi:hypothetical protein
VGRNTLKYSLFMQKIIQILGLFNFSRWHVRNLASIRALLNRLTSNDENWNGGRGAH